MLSPMQIQFCRAEKRQAQQALSRAVELRSFSSQPFNSQPPHQKSALVGYAIGVVVDQEPRAAWLVQFPPRAGIFSKAASDEP
jgi:hypothetical protein